MTSSTARRIGRVLSPVILALVAAAPAAFAQTRTNPDAAIMAEFQKRVEAYVALHKKLESTVPGPAKDSTPQQIDAHQRSLAKLIQENRKGARPGELFTPEMQRVVRRLMRQVFRSEGGAQVKKEILEEYTAPVKLQVNARYPDTVPLSTVPPQVLKGLPKLPEELEYRFVGDQLIILDTHAHIIVDYMERIFP
jgi:hypothetical protein